MQTNNGSKVKKRRKQNKTFVTIVGWCR